ncbi:MAG TPA: hypothetical protein VGI81_05130 [Tepidisphaeraceae bacterium]|jgi:hypothetical protein
MGIRALPAVLALMIEAGGCTTHQCLTIHLYRPTDYQSIQLVQIERSRDGGAGRAETILTDQNGLATLCDAQPGDRFKVASIDLAFQWRDGEWVVEQTFVEPTTLNIPGPPYHAEIPIRLPNARRVYGLRWTGGSSGRETPLSNERKQNRQAPAEGAKQSESGS